MNRTIYLHTFRKHKFSCIYVVSCAVTAPRTRRSWVVVSPLSRSYSSRTSVNKRIISSSTPSAFVSFIYIFYYRDNNPEYTAQQHQVQLFSCICILCRGRTQGTCSITIIAVSPLSLTIHTIYTTVYWQVQLFFCICALCHGRTQETQSISCSLSCDCQKNHLCVLLYHDRTCGTWSITLIAVSPLSLTIHTTLITSALFLHLYLGPLQYFRYTEHQ